MSQNSLPVVLVHGWNSHPGVWNQLLPQLEALSIPYWKFNHAGMNGANVSEIASALGDFLKKMRDETGYTGSVDIVCHSVGTCITRYLLEVIDGSAQQERVRQLIGLGPPNNGSALAELFFDPQHGREIINRLTGIFVPRGFDPAADAIVQDVRPGSPAMQDLRSAGIRPDIIYRIIVTANPQGICGFFPYFEGKTWEITDDGRWQVTLDGDGVVAHRESVLPGISLDILDAGEDCEDNLPSPEQYCHINLPKNRAIIDRILQYLIEGVS